MSYDIRIGVKVADTDIIAVIAEPEYSSPTYNIGTMLRKCMDWDFKQGEWYRVTDALLHIERGIHELRFNRKAYKQYDDPGGWGRLPPRLKPLNRLRNALPTSTTDGHGRTSRPNISISGGNVTGHNAL